MIAIDIKHAENAEASIAESRSKLLRLCEEAKYTLPGLRNMSGMEAIVGRLEQQIAVMEDLAFSIRMMDECIIDCISLYRMREESISDYVEEVQLIKKVVEFSEREVPGWIFDIIE